MSSVSNNIAAPIPNTIPAPKVTPKALPKAQEALKKKEMSPKELHNHIIKQLDTKAPLLKAWEIIVCTITVIGLFILLGLYLGRKQAQNRPISTLKPMLPLNASKDYEKAIKEQRDYYVKAFSSKSYTEKDKEFITALQKFTLEDQLVIFQILSLEALEIKLNSMEELYQNYEWKNNLQDDLQQILNITPLIAKELATIKTLKLEDGCPESIGWLVNLEELNIDQVKMPTPPNLSQNVNLKKLILRGCDLTTPPDLSKNVKLTELGVFGNKFRTPPDLSNNVLLERIDLSENQLESPPDVSKNPNLRSLILSCNKLKTCPDLSENSDLELLSIKNNQLTKLPSLNQNVKLADLSAMDNQLVETPDLSTNVALQVLNLEKNQLTTPPDLTNKPVLTSIRLKDNKFSDKDKKQIQSNYTLISI